MNSASRRWDLVFRKVLQLSEEGKVKIAQLLKQQVEQAKKHPKYFSPRFTPSFNSLKATKKSCLRKSLKLRMRFMIQFLKDNLPHSIFVMVDIVARLL